MFYLDMFELRLILDRFVGINILPQLLVARWVKAMINTRLDDLISYPP